jgi:hypothetical protein
LGTITYNILYNSEVVAKSGSGSLLTLFIKRARKI